jgi:hypothetical protein
MVDVFVKKVDQRRENQAETDRRLKQAQNQLSTHCLDVRRLAIDVQQMKMTIRKSAHQPDIQQQSADFSNVNIEQYDHQIHDHLNQQQVLLHRG